MHPQLSATLAQTHIDDLRRTAARERRWRHHDRAERRAVKRQDVDRRTPVVALR